MKQEGKTLSTFDEALEEAARLRTLVRKCHDAAARALRVAKKEEDEARADRYLEAAARLVASRDALMRQAEDVLLSCGRALRAAGG